MAGCRREPDPVATLADGLTAGWLPDEEVCRLLDRALGGGFVPVKGEKEARAFRRAPRSGRDTGLSAHLGSFSRSSYVGAWLCVVEGSAPPHRDLGLLVRALFPLGEPGSPALPDPQAFRQRLARLGTFGNDPVTRWELPARPSARRAFFLAAGLSRESPDRGPSRLALIALRAVSAADERELTAFHEGVRTPGKGEEPLPAPPPPDPIAESTPVRSRSPLRTGEVELGEAQGAVAAGGSPRVSGLSARLLDTLWGTGPENVTAVLELEPGVRGTVVLPRDGEDARALASLPRLGLEPDPGARMPGDLVWSGRLGPRRVDLYAGRVHALTEFAFEWRPLSPSPGAARRP